MTYIGGLIGGLISIRDLLLSINSKDPVDVENKIKECLTLIKKLNV
jgi:hypothetical protein